jgi:hypothetical protein
MRAILEFLGEEDYGCKHCLAENPECRILCTYAFLVGVSGAASFLSWKEGWHGDNTALAYMSDDPRTPEQHIFEAIGYDYEILDKTQRLGAESVFRRKIVESIQRGMPVLGYGVVGPPEPAIIAGYDEGGDVLIGWSFFQGFPEFEASLEFEPGEEGQPTGYFRKLNWFRDTEGLLIIGEKGEKPSPEETCRRALEWMLAVTRSATVRPEADALEERRNRHNGLAAYDAWVDHLLRDEEFPVSDETTLRARHRVHDDAVGTLAEARWYGSVFLAQLVEGFEAGPGRRGRQEDILHAAACYAAEHDLMWQVWDLAGGIGHPEAYRKLADPAVRRAIADVILQARHKDAQATGHIERALDQSG